MNCNARKPTFFNFAMILFIAFLVYVGRDSKHPVWYTVLHIHNQQFTPVTHSV